MSLVLRSHPSCRQIVELVTSYLEGAMALDDRDRFEMHLSTCGACVTYYEQILAARDAASALREQSIPTETMTSLLAAFRSWKEDRG